MKMLTICKHSYKYEYRGEGNAHLALSLPNENKIVLIKKKAINSSQADHQNWNYSIDFHNKVMKTLLYPFVLEVTKVHITDQEVEEIAKNIGPARPEFRQNKLLMGFCSALMQDYTKLSFANTIFEHLPKISCEIKPKCGIALDNQCSFCFKQADKLKSGRIQRISKYCPRHLYSGNISQMKEAMQWLLENPQNNIQIYKNSKLIYSDKHDLKEVDVHLEHWSGQNKLLTFVNVVVEILRTKFKDVHSCSMCEGTSFSVLDRIKSLQQLDNSKTPPITNDRGYVESLLSATANTDSEDKYTLCSRCKFLSTMSCLSKHYLSKIARDCSIMITVKQLPDNSGSGVNFVCVDGEYYIFDVKVFDLFPKEEKQH